MIWIEIFSHSPVIFFPIIFLLSIVHVFIPILPVESSLALFTGYLAGTHRNGIFLIWVAITTGTSLGGILIYYLTKRKGDRLLRWRFIKDQVNVENLKTAQIWFQKYGAWIIFPGKCVPGMSLVVIFCCGLFQVKRESVLPAIGISNGIYYCGLVLISKYFGRKWEQFGPTIRYLPLITLLICVLSSIAIIYTLQRRYRQKKP
ncbi:MAG TPA: hypothetical protein DDW50_00685 [Firmicutes bacterium]|jgi:membrane protein DedA with SNARE-associated domain|nr:hypothetical protein [Bacillota bacterium]